MKKIKNILFLLVIALLSCNNVYAYSSDLYTIDIPESYKKEENKEFFSKTEENVVTNIYINTEVNKDKINVGNFTTKDIERLEDSFKESISSEELDIKSITSTLYKKSKYPMVILNIVSTYNDATYLYQKEYVISSEENIFYITISSSDKNKINSKELEEVISSFFIKNYVPSFDFNKYFIMILLGILMSVSILLMNRINKRKKQNNK